MNVIDWLNQSAKYMVKETPELYPDGEPEAVSELMTALDAMRESDGPMTCVLFGAFMAIRLVDDGVEEIILTRKVSSLTLFEPEGICRAYGWVPGVELDDPLDDGLDEC